MTDPSEKKEEDWGDFVDRMAGQIIIGLVKGEFRKEVCAALMWAHKRGYESAEKEKGLPR
jgi:hypothetical protein